MRKYLLLSLSFLVFNLLSNVSFSQKIIGTWNGSISLPKGKLPLVFHIKKQQNFLVGTWDSPKEKAFGLKINTISEQNDSLYIQIDYAKIKYVGKIISNDSIHGQFMQNGAIFPLDLIKGELSLENKSNQDSITLSDGYKYYKSDSVKFRNSKDKITLAGTLTVPLNYKNVKPAIVLVSGSGPSDRDENGFGHKIFGILADHLSKNGYPVLRYDDRGVGQSQGDYKTATIKDFSSDALAAISFLREEKHFKNVGLIGHSEGGYIAPMVAADFPDKVNFIVLMAGPGVSGDSLLLLQKKAIETKMGLSKEVVAQSMNIMRSAFKVLKANNDTSIAYKNLNEYLHKIGNVSPSQPLVNELALMYNQLTSSEIYSLIITNPSQYLNRVKCPVLALNGSKDVQVLPDENLAALKSGLTNSSSVAIEKLDGLNHLFQKANTGLPTEYEEISETLDPIFFQALDKWLLQLK